MSQVWFCKIAGDELGPLSPQELRAMAAEGRLSPRDYVRQGAEGPWLPAAAFDRPDDLCFKIPREMILLADRQSVQEEAARPLATGVPEINRRIAELGAKEKQAGGKTAEDGGGPDEDAPDIFRDYPQLRGDDKGADEDSRFVGKLDNSRPSPPN